MKSNDEEEEDALYKSNSNRIGNKLALKNLGLFSSLCVEMQYRSVVIIVVTLSVMHTLMGLVSICLGTISSIQGVVWMAHRVSPIWSGVFFTVTGIAGLLCLKIQTPYITLCYAASTLVSFVSTIVCIQLSRLGLVNHTTDGHVFRKHHIDTLLLVTLGITSFESLVCVAGGFISCRLNSLVKLKMLREGEGPFSVQMRGDKDIKIIPQKKSNNSILNYSKFSTRLINSTHNSPRNNQSSNVSNIFSQNDCEVV